MLDRKLIKNFDFVLFTLAILISIIGVIVITSASHVAATGSLKQTITQSVSIVIGVIALLVITLFDYNLLSNYSLQLYILNILLLVSVFLIGKEINGAKTWIVFGPISLEPVEISKVFLIITLASYLKDKDEITNFKELIYPLILVIIPSIIVILQHSLGSALVFIMIFIGMIFISGIRFRVFSELIGSSIAIMPIVYKLLKPYQRKRLLSFINPNLDPLGAGYHVIQSIISVGSGMFWGEGLFHGTETQLFFLPESQTDFIFSALSEELGFIGSATLILLYSLLLYRAWKIAYNAKDKFGRLISIGILSMFAFHVFENIGMAVGIMPIAGIPLPFVSYGGTSLIVNMMSIGLLINIGMRKNKINF
ncbi:rod shape-determining protein RodA [Thermoanaerobacterium sp. PSU-2]|uniref:rod shape-determining protein RodA n=1 Tax=Thermoanaerobacterium sp. PSU-2 TaxID=1930849 RepID=UPI000A163627|nr:rod shape-determining protein RodA [Thermoanaerobacterium sp. PSU-2]ORX22488.1 rod shape-determining protein RodA [Thermoanaerobacterium sp. PSU-2]